MKRIFTGLITGLCLLAHPVSAYAGEMATETKVMKFTHQFSPEQLQRYSTTVYSASPISINTMRGDEITRLRKLISTFSLSPLGNTCAIISKDKKGNAEIAVNNTTEHDHRIFKMDIKKYGVPTAVTYSQNGRNLIVATSMGLQIFTGPKFNYSETINLLKFSPTEMMTSSNGYYLLAYDEHNVAVINLEDKNIRAEFNYEEKVTDAAFSDSSSELAVLTDEGLMYIYDTRNFALRTTVDDLGQGLGFTFNDNGKYVAVAVSPNEICLINLVKQSDRRTFNTSGGMSDLLFIKDSMDNPILTYTGTNNIYAQRIYGMEPFYAKLISDEVDSRMADWLKMQPGESMDDYRLRVNDESRLNQRRLFEDEISTALAGDMLSMATMTLGSYDKARELLAVNFTNMPTILLPVSQQDIVSFHSGDDLTVSEAQYGILPDDSFELIYAKFHNRNDGKDYLYDNHNRVHMSFLEDDDNVVSLDILQQQQLEEMQLQEIKQQVVEEARHDNVISDHTQIGIDTSVVPDYDANGKKILNYLVKVNYSVDPEFSAVEDFAPGKYHKEESGAATAMANIVRQAFDGQLAQYLKDGKKLKVKLSGSADASPIIRGIPYDGSYGDFDNEPVYQNGQLAPLSVSRQSGIKTNEQLAFLRANGVKDYLEKNVEALKKMNRDYEVHVDVASGKGGEHRRITAEFLFIDAF